MRRFLIGFFAVIGFIVVGIVAGMITVFIVKDNNKPATLPDRMVLTAVLQDSLSEQPQPASFLSASGPRFSLQQIVQTLEMARQDQRIIGLALKLEAGQYGVAAIQELRNAIIQFRKSGKFAYIYADTLGNSPAMAAYWLASGFDQIWLQPMGELAITGFSVEMPFAKEALDKIGVTGEILHAGKYKSYPEMIMRNSSSPENKEMTTALLQDLQRQFMHDVTTTRQINPDAVMHSMQQAPLSSRRALVDGLIDAVGYPDEFDNYLEQAGKGASQIALDDYMANGPRPTPGDKIAVVTVSGALTKSAVEEAIPGQVVSADEISDAITQAGEARAIRAIIVRVDSPGGTPLAADTIHRAIALAADDKPVVISMGDTAASGGYWMSVAAQKIVAQPGTLTGSIGVFGGKINLRGLWQKLGVQWDETNTVQDASLWSMNQPYSDAARAHVTRSLTETYDMFLKRVADGRAMTVKDVDAVAQGRVWTGAQAKKNGLVDMLGGMDVALQAAKKLAKIDSQKPVTLVAFPPPLSPLEQVVKMLQQGVPFHMLGTHIWMGIKQSMTRDLTQVPAIR